MSLLNTFKTKYGFRFFFLLLIILSFAYQANSRGLGYVQREDRVRCREFNENIAAASLLVRTRNISSTLTDETSIDYSRKITASEKEVVCKAIMGGVLIHGDDYREEMFKKAAVARDVMYERHYENMKAVYLASKTLWRMFNEKTEITFESLLQKANLTARRGLLTENFIEWFYETLSAHYQKWSYFSQDASIDWYKKAQMQYERGNISTDFSYNNFHLIRDEDGKPFAIYKQTINQGNDPKRKRPRQTECEVMSWILAKSLGLDSVVNPVLPIRLRGRHLSLDYFCPTGTLEPIASVIYKGESTEFVDYDEKIRPFLKRYLEFVKEEKKDMKAVTFSQRGWTMLGFNKCSLKTFFMKRLSTGASKLLDDIKTLTRHDVLNPDELLKIALFVFLTRHYDPHVGNVIFVPQTNGKFKPVIYDYDLTWNPSLWSFTEKEVDIHNLDIHEFDQAKAPVNQDIILQVWNKLGEFSSVFRLLGRRVNDGEFSPLVTRAQTLKDIACRVPNLKKFVKEAYANIKIKTSAFRTLRIQSSVILWPGQVPNRFMTMHADKTVDGRTEVDLDWIFSVTTQEQFEFGPYRGYCGDC